MWWHSSPTGSEVSTLTLIGVHLPFRWLIVSTRDRMRLRTMKLRRCTALAVVAVLVACRGEDRPADTSSAMGAAERSPWHVSPEPVRSVGVLDGDPEYQFVNISAAGLQSDGDLVVADLGTHSVRLFAPDGTFKRVIGGPGQGPGEFQSPSQVFIGDQDSIFVWDREAWRVSSFDAEGAFAGVRSYPLAQITKATAAPLYPKSAILLPNRDILVSLIEKASVKGLKEGSREARFRPGSGALRVSADMQSVDTLMFFGDLEQVTVSAPWGDWAMAPPLARQPSFAVDGTGGRVCIGDQSASGVTCFAEDGTETSIEWSASPLPLGDDEAEIATWRDAAYASLGAKVSADDMRGLLAEVPMPTERPPYTDLHLAPSGELWVTHGPVGEFVEYFLFDRAGASLGAVQAPNARLLSVGQDHLLTVRVDEMGIQRLEMYEMTSSAKTEASDTVRVMAYNIHHGAGMDEVLDLERIAALIREVNPDLLALQEIDSVATRTGGVDQAAELGRLTGMTPVFGRFMPYQGGAYGMAVLSRWRIAASRNIRLPDGDEPRSSVVVDVTSPSTGEMVRFASIHFYRTEDERLAQALELAAQLPNDGVPTILAGDYNSTPGSFVMDFFADEWGIVDKGTDRFTFSSFDPVREIDFVVMRPKDRFTVLRQRVLDEPVASDHRPLFVDFIIHR
jgi:endonuclease/exonuclease/phosphatase family metal-dependent hydrolase